MTVASLRRWPSIPRGILRYLDVFIACAAMIMVSTFDSVRSDYSGVWLVLFSPLAIVILLIIWLAAGVLYAVQFRWRSVVRQLIKTAVLCALVIPCLRAGDYIHLIVMYHHYAGLISASDNTELRFEWGDKALWVTDGMMFDTLVYDPTDALSAAVGQDRASGGMGLSTRHLFGHFYVEREFSE